MRQKRRTGCGFLFIVLLSVLILGGAWFLTTWRSGSTVLPPGLTINGLPMGGMTREQALLAIEQAYTVPISVTYAGETIQPLLPEIIELRLDTAATAENLDAALEAEGDAYAFVRYILDEVMQREPKTIPVTGVILYSRERVNAFLERTAQKYDHAPTGAIALPDARTFRPAQEGTKLNIDASLPLLIEAILAADPQQRQVSLVVETEPPPDTSIDVLSQALLAALSDFGGQAGIFVKELRTGQELCLDCRGTFEALSTMKIGILLELYRVHDLPLLANLASPVDAMITQDDHEAANVLLGELGAGDPYAGAEQVTGFLRSMGLGNTYLAGPYPTAQEQTAHTVEEEVTAGAPMATTPMELGLLMESVYHCSHGGGSLRVLYPHTLTPAECDVALDWLGRSQTPVLLAGGMPAGTRVVGLRGSQGETYVDASLVYGPRTDFVIVTFLTEPGWSSWEESVPAFTRVGELTYRYFNGGTEPAMAEGQ